MTAEGRFGSLYDRWLSEAGVSGVPAEEYASCDSCPMCAPHGTDAGPFTMFSPSTKCCTYWPVLPNYLVGKALVDDTNEGSEGRSRLLQIINTDSATPRALGPTREYATLYKALKRQDFGRNVALVCPYLNTGDGDGACSIWRHRNGTCSTWFCKHVRGKVGLQMWHAFHLLLGAVEDIVSYWCAVELKVPHERAILIFQNQVNDGSPVRRVQVGALWQEWNPRRDEFYRRCYEVASQLSWTDIVRIGGTRLPVLMGEARNRLSEVVRPTGVIKARQAPFRVLRMTTSQMFIESYRPTDPRECSPTMLVALRYFDGGYVRDTLEKLAAVENIALNEDEVQEMVDMGLLEEVK